MKILINKMLFVACAVSLLVSCSKDPAAIQDFSSAVFINASPATPPMTVLIDTATLLTVGSPTTHFGNTGYQGIEPGNHRISFINQPASGARLTFADLPNENFEANKAYSYFLYDTLINGKARTLRLNDEIAPPPAGNVNIRFIHLAPQAGAVDVTLVRGTTYTEASTGVSHFIATDSVTISNVNYVGDNPDVNVLSAFRSISASTGITVFTATGFANVPPENRNNRYFVRIKRAGTQTIIAQNITTSATAAGIPSTNTLIAGRVYTIYLSGSVKAVATNFAVFEHFRY